MSNLIYGIHAVHSLIESNKTKDVIILKKIHTLNFKIKHLIDNAKQKGIKITFIDSLKELPISIRKDVNHQNIFAIESNNYKTYSEKDIKSLIPKDKNAFILILDSVQDPHNFGACIRSAHAAGVNFIIVPKDNSAPINTTVRKVACGAVEHIKIILVTNLSRAIKTLKEQGIWIIGLACEANENLYDMNLNDSIAIISGAEGSGMRKLTKANCDFLAKLPMFGKVTSLNISVATGIALYETIRQRI